MPLLGVVLGWGTLFGGPYNKDPGTILGSPIFGNPHVAVFIFRIGCCGTS